jgi:hypothetical protein
MQQYFFVSAKLGLLVPIRGNRKFIPTTHAFSDRELIKWPTSRFLMMNEEAQTAREVFAISMKYNLQHSFIRDKSCRCIWID